MASIHRSEGLCSSRASYPPSCQSSHAASENTVAVCHKRTPSSLQVMDLLELAGDKEPPGVSPELCQANSPPTANYLLGQERRLQPDQRGLQTASPTPSMCFLSAQISHPLLWTKAKRDWLFGSPLVPQAVGHERG